VSPNGCGASRRFHVPLSPSIWILLVPVRRMDAHARFARSTASFVPSSVIMTPARNRADIGFHARTGLRQVYNATRRSLPLSFSRLSTAAALSPKSDYDNVTAPVDSSLAVETVEESCRQCKNIYCNDTDTRAGW